MIAGESIRITEEVVESCLFNSSIILCFRFQDVEGRKIDFLGLEDNYSDEAITQFDRFLSQMEVSACLLRNAISAVSNRIPRLGSRASRSHEWPE